MKQTVPMHLHFAQRQPQQQSQQRLHMLQDSVMADGKLAAHGNVNWYILQPGKGFAFHTQDFKNGYVAGFCNANPSGGSDADQATFSCN